MGDGDDDGDDDDDDRDRWSIVIVTRGVTEEEGRKTSAGGWSELGWAS